MKPYICTFIYILNKIHVSSIFFEHIHPNLLFYKTTEVHLGRKYSLLALMINNYFMLVQSGTKKAQKKGL
jgi:hypothetical protein